MERTWPLTGRDDELRTVAAAVRAGAAGIVVAGPAGVGKTRLAREAVALAARGGAQVLWAHGSAVARPLPLGAFAGLLDVPPGDAAHTVGRALEQLARHRSPVLAVDDAHLLDEHSAILLDRVVERRAAPVLVTVRTGEPTPDAVTALWKDDRLGRLDLAPLDPARTTALVARVLGGPVEAASAHRLWTLTEGSPLFLRHLLTGEVSAGRFTVSAGIWRWVSEPTLSPALADLLAGQIGSLDPGVQDVVDVVALAEPVAVTALCGLTSAADVEQAEARGLVRTDETVARLAHPLYGEVRRSGMGTLRARRLRGLVARTLDTAPDPIPRAVLTLDSDLEPDPALFLQAAEAATRLFDLPLAERLARAAATTGAPVARLVHAAALSWLSRGDDAEAVLADLAATAPDAGMQAMAHLHRAGNLMWTLARPDDADRALAAARATAALPLHVAAMSLALAAAAGDVTTVLAQGPALLRTDDADDLVRILASSAVTAAAALTGDRALLDEAADVGGLGADRVPPGIPGFGLADMQVLGNRLAGTPGRADDRVRRLVAVSADLPGPARLMGLVVAGHAALAGGRVADALPLLQDAWAGLADSGHEFRFRCRTLLATARALAGDADRAAPHLDGIVAGGHPAYRIFAPDDLLARAWGAAAEGSTTEATAHATAAAELARATGAPAWEVLAWQTVVQLGDATPALAPLTALAGLGPRAATANEHARARVADDGAALLRVSTAWTGLGDLVAAGDAAAQAAAAHRRAGRRGSAYSAAALAADLAGRSGARTPALASAVRPLPLTGREREIVTLAAGGASNRAIAGRLTVSVRTVEGHLYRAGLKLGVSERAGFAAVLGLASGPSAAGARRPATDPVDPVAG
ncbi:LuxR C-terminal-related transcriptional regulator [Isoptericola dokdonensis]|uniref:Bacterial regulatory protein, luxR family n=1 Tax=Isoptericola dokdonensis DS-3 TaxID=1300344 RepID=A0A161IGQ2_9MICO|nr:LuxR family transcriptional regulator [Isoptericola dokdonensis]ANC30764.1 Bacterial regulatory protein, luxR family [Isoptericola dokdonensis DS-3]